MKNIRFKFFLILLREKHSKYIIGSKLNMISILGSVEPLNQLRDIGKRDK